MIQYIQAGICVMSLIYIVEDDENIREIEEYALRSAGYDVSAFDCASKFLNVISKTRCDLAVLDIMLPDVDGMKLLKMIRKDQNLKELPVIMVTAKTSEMDIVKGLDSGADDYISKPFSILEFVSRIRTLLRRFHIERDTVIHSGNITMDDDKRTVTLNSEEMNLTFKEYELLHYLIENEGRVLSREQIMSRVWETDYIGESRTMDMHIKSLRQKLGEEANRLKTVRNVGYVLENHEKKA